ncbi:hypothetical protein [Kitasatospora cathayae]|uniref:WxL domain-containing protein n=1 Tax=Kitasatospora cathayae TaxID=3004092 RepID=A0ABY7QCK1_9ACTN|nr:hypothetical protein [Kitasatospora sp. HUAS 3-15]WBP90327.1 hypothetical protein O1G21_33690 [Kitasatospora sp. HUAS 3-15]
MDDEGKPMRIRYSVVAGVATVVAVAGVASAAPGDTTVTFSVSGGSLAISVPGSAGLGSGLPGNTLSGQLGNVTVTDTRALLTAAWTASVISTSFKTGGGTAAETIPASAVSYWSGTASSTTGLGVFTPGQATAGQAQTLDVSRTAYSLTGGTGNNSATWNPTLVIAIPNSAVNGTYTGTVTHSIA